MTETNEEALRGTLNKLRIESLITVQRILKLMNDTSFLEVTQPGYGLIVITLTVPEGEDKERYITSINGMIEDKLIPNSPVDLLYELKVKE